MNKNDEFTCDQCGEACTAAWSDEEANAEAKAMWGVDTASQNDGMAIVCDDCFIKITGNGNI